MQVWVPQQEMDIKLTLCLKESYEDSKGSKGHNMCRVAEIPGFAQPRAELLRGGLMAAVAPHREQKGSAELHSGDRQSPRGQHGAADWGGVRKMCTYMCLDIAPPTKKKEKGHQNGF